MFCKHDWKVLNEVHMLSAAEVHNSLKTGKYLRNASAHIQKHRTTFACSKCGKLHHRTDVTPWPYRD